MIEAKKLAYANMLRYVGDTRFGGSAGHGHDREIVRSAARAGKSTSRAAADVQPSAIRWHHDIKRRRHDLSCCDR